MEVNNKLDIMILNLTEDNTGSLNGLLSILNPLAYNTNITTVTYNELDTTNNNFYDGIIIIGDDTANTSFYDNNDWDKLSNIIDWSNSHSKSILHIGLGTQLGLYHYYKIEQHPLNKSLVGIYSHLSVNTSNPLVFGFDDEFFSPHNRCTTIYAKDIKAHSELDIVAISNNAGIFLVTDKEYRHIFCTGHPEYERLTLHEKLIGKLSSSESFDIPENYYPCDDFTERPQMKWKAHASLLIQNWIHLLQK